MARYPVVSTSTIILTSAGAGPLLTARSALISAEDRFYRERRDLVNSYPMKTRDITTAEIESLYDTYLGTEPWRYKSRFTASGSTLKSGSYGNNDSLFGSGGHEEFYVEEWGNTPTGSYPQTIGSGGFPSGNPAFMYDEERGASWVDLIVKFGYTRGFTGKGGSRSMTVSGGAGDGASTGYVTVYQGFGREPVAYNGRGGLSGFEAHMLKLVGDAWDDTVGDAYDNYRNALDAYRGGVGSPTDADFSSTPTAQPWEGFVGTSGGYNRPEELVAALVRETRGVS